MQDTHPPLRSVLEKTLSDSQKKMNMAGLSIYLDMKFELFYLKDKIFKKTQSVKSTLERRFNFKRLQTHRKSNYTP